MKLLDKKTEEKIESIISSLTLEQKIGQMNQSVAWAGTEEQYKERIRRGEVGTFIVGVPAYTGDRSAEHERRRFLNSLQKTAIEESPCGIPLLFGADVIHGYDLVYPIPLATAAAFDRDLTEKVYRNIAVECARDGLNWTFAPVLDLPHDPRWGRCVEDGGEDPYLNGQTGAAAVRGFQGDLGNASLIACCKHYIGYGAMEGGRDYHNSDISDYYMDNYYAPSFKMALDAGALTVMSSFNSVAGEPVTASKKLLRDLLKKRMDFEGFVISDYDAVKQLETQGVAADKRECARIAAEGGVDMEMVDTCYPKYLADLVRSGELDEEVINEAVRRVLRVKFAANLFENPYKEDYEIDKAEHAADALRVCSENVVLLKNNGVLPLSKDEQVFMAGPYLNEKHSHVGAWAGHYDVQTIPSFREAAESYLGEGGKVQFGGSPFGDFEVESMENCKAVVLFLGETLFSTGEAVSVDDLTLPEDQIALIHRMKKKGVPLVGVICCGRPRALGNVIDLFDAVIYGWHNGSYAAPAMMRVLYGDANPCGHLPMTLPRVTGQIPVYYNALSPARDVNEYYGRATSYYGTTAAPLYPFGYGLSYTAFEYSAPECDKTEISLSDLEKGKKLRIKVTVKNTGERDGKTVAQCYVRDLVGSMMRPVRQLVGYEKKNIRRGRTTSFTFDIGKEQLGFFGSDRTFRVEKGEFEIYVGECATTTNKITIKVI